MYIRNKVGWIKDIWWIFYINKKRSKNTGIRIGETSQVPAYSISLLRLFYFGDEDEQQIELNEQLMREQFINLK